MWVARYNGPGNDRDLARALAVDGSGNVYVTGFSYGSGTGADYATIKYDAGGNELWVAKYNGPAENAQDQAYALAVDDSGNVYVTGYSYDYGTYSDYTTIKYDSDGNELWVARYNGPGNGGDYARALVVDGSGNVYVTGRSYGYGSWGEDYATVKYDSEGNELWVARYNGPTNMHDRAWAIAVDGSGNVYVTGESYGYETGWDFDQATVKYDAGGNELWVARYNGPANRFDAAWAIAVDDSGNVYVTGFSDGSGTSYDYATVKYDAGGNELWVAKYNGPTNGYDRAWALTIDDSESVYVTGRSGSGTGADYATIKYDPEGNEEWVARYDGPENEADWARALAVDGSGNVYVTGFSYGSGTYYDYATIKYTSNGNELWVARYNGPGNYYDDANAIAVDDSGNVYVTGESSGSGTGYSDYATIKYDSDVINAHALLAIYDANVENEDLEGLGPGASSQYREDVIRKLIVNVVNCITDGHFEAACEQLQIIYLMIDGETNPSDFIGGNAVVMEEFRQHVLELLDVLG